MPVTRELSISDDPGVGVVFEAIQVEHYSQRIEDLDASSLDEGNFLAGSLGVAVSMVIALLGVVFGTEKPQTGVVITFAALFIASAVLTLYFWLKYTKAKCAMKRAGAVLAREIREVAASQQTRREAQ